MSIDAGAGSDAYSGNVINTDGSTITGGSYAGADAAGQLANAWANANSDYSSVGGDWCVDFNSTLGYPTLECTCPDYPG